MMKKLTFALLTLLLVLALIGYRSAVDTPQTDATAPTTVITDDQPTLNESTADKDTDSKANTPTDNHTSTEPDDDLALAIKGENYPVQGPRETHSMEAASIVASYLAGEWEADQPLWSEDYSTRVAAQADGSLIYTMNEHVNFCNDSEILFARRLAVACEPPTAKDPENPSAEANSTKPAPMPIPSSWPGEKVYIDLPNQVLPEGTWNSSYVVGEGTYVQTQQGVTLYRQGEVVDTWNAKVEERTFLVTKLNCNLGENFLLTDDQLLRLVPGGTTEVVYDHVVDAGHNTVPFLIVLTIDDGVLAEHYYWESYGWKDIEIASDVTEARFGLGATIFRDDDGLTYVATPRIYCYDPESTVVCVGERTLDNLEGLWESFNDSYITPKKLTEFLTKYGTGTVTISDPVTSGNSCDSDDTTGLFEINRGSAENWHEIWSGNTTKDD